MLNSRLNILFALSGFSIPNTPFNYLEVSIFKGKSKVKFLQLITDKVIKNLAPWKGSLLSFPDRIELVKSTSQSRLIHSIPIYVWLVTLVRDLERAT